MKSFLIKCSLLFVFFSCQKDNINQQTLDQLEPSKNSLQKDTPSTVDWVFHYVDTFDDADVFNDYGINSNLADRQLHGPWKNTAWIRRTGSWNDLHQIKPWFSQVNHPTAPNQLSFHSGLSSTILNYRIWPGSTHRYRVSFDVDPVIGDTNSTDWVSFMLENDQNARGYVSETDFGFLIRSNGNIQVFQDTNEIVGTLTSGQHQTTETYHVVLDITPQKVIVDLNNGAAVYQYTLNGIPIESAHPFFGAEITPESNHVSSVDNLVINTPNTITPPHIKHYGYYWALGQESPTSGYNNRLDQVDSYTNFNFIAPNSFSELFTLNNNKKYSLQYRWNLWPDSGGNLRSDWEYLWTNTFKNFILPNENKLSSLYIIDEPFWAANVTTSDYNQVLNKVRGDLSVHNLDTPITAIFAYTTIRTNDILNTDGLGKISDVIDNLDYAGLNVYHIENFDTIKTDYLNPLKEVILSKNKKMILVPQSFLLNASSINDTTLASLGWEYYNYALENNCVIGIKNYGLWTDTQPEEISLTVQVQKLLGNAIVNY